MIINLFLILFSSLNFPLVDFTENNIYRLTDSQSGAGIAYAHIYVIGEESLIVSNLDGYFSLLSRSPGEHLRISHLNYGVQEVSLSESIRSSNVISLEPKVVTLDEVYVESKSGWFSKDAVVHKLASITTNLDQVYAIHAQEFVETNDKIEKFAEGTGKITYDRRNDFIGFIDQCRSVALPRETDSYMELLNPIPLATLTMGLSPDFFKNLSKKLASATDYSLVFENDFALVRFSIKEDDRYLRNYEIVFDSDDRVIQVDSELFNSSNYVRNLLLVKVGLRSAKLKFIFASAQNPVLTFSRLETDVSVDFKGEILASRFVSQANVGVTNEGLSKEMNKKEVSKPLYKNCKGYITEFWEETSMPIFSQQEYLRVMELLEVN